MTTRKICTACNGYKPLADFHLHSSTLDGRQGQCKKCLHAARAERFRQKAAAHRQKWLRIAQQAERTP
jgi:hypothetical protein